jgi:hypothetical protein
MTLPRLEDAMPLFIFISWCLTTIGVVTLIWPLNIPLLALAYKVRLGYRAVPLSRAAFWWRSTFGSLGLAGMTVVLLGLLYTLVAGAEFTPQQVQLVLLMAYLPAAVWYLFWIFAMEDMFESLSVFLLYILLSGLPLLLIGRWLGWWESVAKDNSWLLISPKGES